MQRIWQIILVVIAAFAIHEWIDELYFQALYDYLQSLTGTRLFSYFLTYVIVGMPLFVGVLFLHPARAFWSALGLHQPIGKALIVALVCTLPMLVGYAIVFEWNSEITWSQVFGSAICAALFEELYYRGFLFGQIFRFTRIGFIPSIIIGALLFASAHLYQSQDPATLLGIFLTTFMGAILFAWAYIEWDNNLWVPIFLHLFMNLFWMLFSAGDNALGGGYANIFRIMTIALIIGGTIWYKKHQGWPLAINRRTLWMQSKT
jgi:membrane protease YdiL (CAAX protease family)